MSIDTVEAPSFQNILAMLNTASGPLADLKLRQAVAEAIDYDGIVQTLGGSLVKATGVVPPGLLGYTDAVQPTTDVAAARQALSARPATPDSNKLKLSLTYAEGDPLLDTIVTVMKANLAAVGIDLEAKALAWPTSVGTSPRARIPPSARTSSCSTGIPTTPTRSRGSSTCTTPPTRPTSTCPTADDPQVDKVIDGLQAVTATDRDKAQQEYVDLQKTILRPGRLPVLGVTNSQRAISSSASGYVDNPAYSNVVFVHDLTPSAG